MTSGQPDDGAAMPHTLSGPVEDYLKAIYDLELVGAPASTNDIADRMHRGERSRLLLANRAIRAYQRHKADHIIELVR